MRARHSFLLLAAAAAALGACASTTETLTDADALDAAAELQRLVQPDADFDVSTAYFNVAGTVGRIGRVSPITVVVDGRRLDFLATAQTMELDPDPACSRIPWLCVAMPPVRSVIAWQKGNPGRLVQFTSTAGGTAIGQGLDASTAGSAFHFAALTYFDGSGGVYGGTSGTLGIPQPATSDTPCPGHAPPDFAPDGVRCTLAEFTASMGGSVAPPPFVLRGNTATGTHTIAIAPQSVHGARLVIPAWPALCPGCISYPPFAPPVYLRGGNLHATLGATATPSLVTLELRITNPRTVPVTVQRSSGQQFDLRVRRQDGTTVWTWSADKAFPATIATRTFAPGETVTYTATWTPTEHGAFVAEGWLTSTSHTVGAGTTFLIP